MMSRVLLAVAVCALLAAVSTAVSSESPLHHQHHVTAHKHHTPLHPSGALAVKKSLDTLARDVSRLLEEEVKLIDALRTESAKEAFPPRLVQVQSELDGVETIDTVDEHDSCEAVANWMMGTFFPAQTALDGAVDWGALQENTAYQIAYKVSWTEAQINAAVEAGADEDLFGDEDDYEIHNFVVVRMAGDNYYLLQAALGHFSLKQWLSADAATEDEVLDESEQQLVIAGTPSAGAHQTFGQGQLFPLGLLQAHIDVITNAVTTEAIRKEAVLAAFGFNDAYAPFVTYLPTHTHRFLLVSSATVPEALR